MILDSKLSLNPDGAAQVQPTQKLNLYPDVHMGNSLEYADDLASKYSASLGELSPGEDVMRDAINQGNTDRYAQLLKQQQDLESLDVRNSIVQEIANSGNITPYDTEIVRGLAESDLSSDNLGAVLEDAYSKKVINLAATLSDENDNTYTDALETNVDATDEVVSRAQWQGARNLAATTILDNLKNKFSDSGLVSQGWAWAQQIVPFRDDVSLWTTDLGPVGKSFFKGDTKKDAYAYLSTLPPGETKVALQAYVDRELQSGNYFGAMQFVEGYLSYSDSDANWDNLFQALDVASFIPVTKLAKVMKGAARAVTSPIKDAERMAAAADMPAEATRAAFAQSLGKGVFPSKDIVTPSDIERVLPSIMRPQELFAGRTLRAGGPALTRLEQAAIARAGTALEIVTGINRVERLSPTQIEKGFEEAETFLKDNFVNINQKVVDVKRTLAEDTPSNTYSVAIQIGKTDGSAFSNKLSALKAAKTIALRTNDYQVKQLPNGGWVVEVSRYVDETTGGIRNVKIDTDWKMPDNFVTRFLGGAVGADNLLSKSQQQARGVAVMTSEHMGTLLESFAEPIRRMTKAQRKEFEDFLTFDRSRIDNQNGRSVPPLTPFDFEDLFYQQFNKLPSVDQMDAYIAHKQLYDLDRLVRDYSVLKQKATMGIEKFSFKIKGDEGKASTLEFEGKEVGEFPRGIKDNYSIAVVDEEGNLVTGDKFNSRYMSQKDWDKVNDYVKNDYKIIQAFEGSKKINGKYYNYVMVRNFKRDKPSLGNITYSGSTRQIEKSPWYLKQPKITAKEGRAYYHGDTSIANFRSHGEALEGEKILNNARRMIRDRSPGAVKYFQENVPFWHIKDFLREVQKGNISLNSPIKVTSNGARSVDTETILHELRAEGLNINAFQKDDYFNLSKQITGKFLGEEGSKSMEAYGVEKGTIFKLEGQGVLSPLDTMRYSMSNLIDTHVIHDYRIKSVRDFVSTYKHILKGEPHDFDTNPLEFLFEPQYVSKANPNEVRSAEGQRKAILSLFNNKTIVERQVDMYKERIVNTVRKLAGKNVANFVQDSALPWASNADTAMRAFAFHTKMGFFNIRQLFLQSTAAVNILAISPVHGVRGAASAWPIIFAMNTKRAFLGDIGKKLFGTTGVKPEEFEELTSMYRRSGFYNVGGDVAYLDNMKPPSLVKGKVKWVLDAGGMPFRAGEKIARTMAFSTAYFERKALRKTAKMSRADEAWILQRAKDLTGNMTRDSNAAYQRGYGAIATQFFGYQMRLMEQMLGSKLTTGEKARLFTGMSLVYGVPVAAGMTVGVWPIREWLKDELAKNGIEYDDTIAEPFMDGFASQFLETATGMDLNVSERYGPGGLTTFYDLMKKDADLSEALLGASGGIVGDSIKDTGGIIKMIWETVDLNDQTNFPVSLSDLVEPFRNVSTVNNVTKYWEAIHLGQWISKNENALTDVDSTEAMWSAVFGLDPERVSDAFNKIEAINALKDMQNEAMTRMVADYRRGLQALHDSDPKSAEMYFKRVKSDGVRAGLKPQQMTTVYNRAIDGRPLDATIEDQYNKYFGAK